MPSIKKNLIIAAAITLALSGCMSTAYRSPQADYSETYRQAYMAMGRGDWLTYKKLMQVVIHASTAGNAPAKERSIYWYEYGRASGVVCDWEDAEFALTVSNNLDSKLGGPTHMSLNELGRISVVRKQFDKAVDYFTRGMKGFEEYQEKISNKESKPYLVSAQIREEFAYALEQVKGESSEIQKLKETAAEIRKKISSKEAINSDIAPYGTQCKAP